MTLFVQNCQNFAAFRRQQKFFSGFVFYSPLSPSERRNLFSPMGVQKPLPPAEIWLIPLPVADPTPTYVFTTVLRNIVNIFLNVDLSSPHIVQLSLSLFRFELRTTVDFRLMVSIDTAYNRDSMIWVVVVKDSLTSALNKACADIPLDRFVFPKRIARQACT